MAQAQLILDELKKCGITHILTVPDNMSKALLDVLAVEESIRVLPVTREGEAFAIAAGLWVGGSKPAVLIQNTGLLETGDALRGTAMRMRIPLLCLITYRGFGRLKSRGLPDATRPIDADLLSEAELDSAAVLTERTLQAWSIPYDFIHNDEDIIRVSRAFRQSLELQQPVAILITADTT